jgi:hypothetical protein
LLAKWVLGPADPAQLPVQTDPEAPHFQIQSKKPDASLESRTVTGRHLRRDLQLNQANSRRKGQSSEEPD